MYDFCKEEVDVLSVSLNKTKQEVGLKDRQEFSWTKISTSYYWSEKTLIGFPREALEFATSKALQGEKKLLPFVVLTHDK